MNEQFNHVDGQEGEIEVMELPVEEVELAPAPDEVPSVEGIEVKELDIEEIDALPAPEGEVHGVEIAQVFEDVEQGEVLTAIADNMSVETGRVISPEDLMSGDPEMDKNFESWLECHPKARKLLQVFTLSTALVGVGAAQEVHANDLGNIANILLQGEVRAITTGVNQDVREVQVRRNEGMREWQTQEREQLNRERVEFSQEQAIERFDHNRAMQRSQLERRASAQQMYDFDRQTALQHDNLLFRQHQDRKKQDFNERQHGEQRQLQREAGEGHRAYGRVNTQEQIEARTMNQVIQYGANALLRGILTQRR